MASRKTDSTALYAFDEELRTRHGLLCGVDEAGRGPLCGPVCCAAVILDPADPVEGVNDSKKLSAKTPGRTLRGDHPKGIGLESSLCPAGGD